MKRLIPVLLGFGIVVLAGSTTSADFDLPGLNQQVQQQQSQLDNHEARITNLEKDTHALEQQTNTTPAPDPVPVPEVAPAPAATPDEAAPVEDAPAPILNAHTDATK